MKYQPIHRDVPNRSYNSRIYGAISWEEASHYAFEAWRQSFSECYDNARTNGTYPPDESIVPNLKDFRLCYQLELKFVGGKMNEEKDTQ
jgi:hypothetical protein